MQAPTQKLPYENLRFSSLALSFSLSSYVDYHQVLRMFAFSIYVSKDRCVSSLQPFH